MELRSVSRPVTQRRWKWYSFSRGPSIEHVLRFGCFKLTTCLACNLVVRIESLRRFLTQLARVSGPIALRNRFPLTKGEQVECECCGVSVLDVNEKI